mgnify:CR=1 FL=1
MTTFTPPTIEELQDQFPQYHIEGFIAQGGMGAVYLARQISLDRPVAIKILPQEFGEDKDYRFSFETEAKAMARLNHTNLVGIYDFGEIDWNEFKPIEHVLEKLNYQGSEVLYNLSKNKDESQVLN